MLDLVFKLLKFIVPAGSSTGKVKDMEDIDWQNCLLTSLNSQVEFLKEEIKIKNAVNAKLLELINTCQIKYLKVINLYQENRSNQALI